MATLVRQLGSEFYADADMIAEALLAGRPFNVIHFASTAKFDIFPVSQDPYQQSQFERQQIAEEDLGGSHKLRCL